ncbi:hypothetical protein PspLS_04254 [Pyricularia sp. CBS 133598]|nr:hypothetical protein PspLS_04254 [Pyricularia sp. CBS 133598]
MEALAAGASIIGVISLAIQLIEVSTKFLSFYDSISNTAKELSYLKGLIFQVRFVAVGVQNIFGEYQRAHGDGGRIISLVPGIHVALQDCFTIVTEIQNVIDKAGTRLWSKVEFARKQQNIARYEQRLGLALQFFHTNLSMASMFYEASERSRFSAYITKQESFTALFQDSSITVPTDAPSPVSLNTQEAVEVASQMQTWSNCVSKVSQGSSRIFRLWKIRQSTTTEKTQIGKGYAETKRVETVFSIIPPFLHWSINFCRRDGNSLFYGLQITPVRHWDEFYYVLEDLFRTPCSQEEEVKKLTFYVEKLDLDEEIYLIPRHHKEARGIANRGLDTIQQLASKYVQTPFLAGPDFCRDLITLHATWWPFASHLAERRLRVATYLVNALKTTKQEESLRQSLHWISRASSAESRIAILNEWAQILHQKQVEISTVLSKEWPKIIERNANKFRDYSAERLYVVHHSVSASGGTEFTQTPWYEPDSPISELTGQFQFCADVEISRGCYCKDVFDKRLKSYSAVENNWRCIPDLYRASTTLEAGQSPNDGIGEDTMEELFAQKYTWLQNLCRCNLEGEYVDLWPFCGRTHTMCRSGNHIDDLDCLGLVEDPEWCEYHRCRFNHQRFARKEARKMDKNQGWPEKKLRRKRVPGAWVE